MASEPTEKDLEFLRKHLVRLRPQMPPAMFRYLSRVLDDPSRIDLSPALMQSVRELEAIDQCYPVGGSDD